MKFIYSIGPKSIKTDILNEFLKNAYAFRLNTAHLKINNFKKYLNCINESFLKSNTVVPVYVDLQGAKIRTAYIKNSFF